VLTKYPDRTVRPSTYSLQCPPPCTLNFSDWGCHLFSKISDCFGGGLRSFFPPGTASPKSFLTDTPDILKALGFRAHCFADQRLDLKLSLWLLMVDYICLCIATPVWVSLRERLPKIRTPLESWASMLDQIALTLLIGGALAGAGFLVGLYNNTVVSIMGFTAAYGLHRSSFGELATSSERC